MAEAAGAETSSPTSAEQDKGRMTFTEHLAELRDRLVRVAIVVLLAFFVAFAYRDPLFDFMAAPIKEELARFGIYNLRAIEITETIFVYLKLSVVAAFFATLPYTFYQFWAFVAPGLLEREKRAVTPLIFFSTFFFILGAYFAYEIIIPFITNYLTELTLSGGDDIKMEVTVQSAFSFSWKLLLAFGLAFELPLVMFFLAFLGVMTVQRYIKAFRIFVVLSFIVAALFTPPDPISQLLMAVPLNVLYWVGVGAAYFVARSKRGKNRKLTIPSRVWGVMTLALLGMGGVLGAGTWYLGQTPSPLQWIPADSVWVVSVRLDTTLGDDAPPERRAALVAQLGLPAEAPEVDRVILCGGPDGKQLAILANACADAAPSIGTCAGNDLLLGDPEWVEVAEDGDSDMDEHRVLSELETSAPTWIWHTAPDSARILTLLPGETEGLEVAGLIVTADLRSADPWIELALRMADEEEASTLQNRVDLWRAAEAGRRELQARDQESAKSTAELLRLVGRLVVVTEERFEQIDAGVRDAAKLETIEERYSSLRESVTEWVDRIDAANQRSTPQGDSAVAKLSEDGLRNWKTASSPAEFTMRLDLSAPKGIDGAIRVLSARLAAPQQAQ